VKDSFYRLTKAFRNYRNPFWLALQRGFGATHVEVTERASGLSFRCLRGADRMLGETFHGLVYDVPMAPVGPGDLVIDVGANHGFAACHFARKGARVLAFEPSPEVFPLLVSNIARNGLEGRVQALRAAVTGRDGTTLLHPTPALGGGMSTTNTGFAQRVGVSYGAPIQVEARSICSVLAALGPARVRLLKLDCEGAELEILEALRPADLERIDSLALEYHPEAHPLADVMRVLLSWERFSVYKVPAGDTPNANLHAVQVNVVRAWSEEAR
jgi:FkbM family methyltransferase